MDLVGCRDGALWPEAMSPGWFAIEFILNGI